MKRARRLSRGTSLRLWPSSFLRSISIAVGLVLIVTSLVLSPMVRAFAKRPVPGTKSQSQQNNRQERRVTPLPPRTGPPSSNLPNLDELRSAASGRQSETRVVPPRPIPSAMRSRRKPGARPPSRTPGARLTPREGFRDQQHNPTRVANARSGSHRRAQAHHAQINSRAAERANTSAAAAFMQSQQTNFALASNGATVSASSSLGAQVTSYAINGDRKGLSTSWWTDDTSFGYPDWIEVSFAGVKTINEIDLIGLQQNWANPVEPTEQMTSTYALTNFEVQYWTGSAWATISGGSITANDKVWRKLTFASLATSRVRINVTYVAGDNHSQVVEVEAWGPSEGPANVALASSGATASASSTMAAQTPGKAIDGDRMGLSSNWWTDDTSYGYPDWIQVNFSGSKTISGIDVFGLQQNYGNPVEPTPEMTSSYALTNFEVQYWDGGAWVTVPGGTVTGNDKVWKKFTFAALTTSKIRVNITHVAGDNHSQVVEVEAWGTAATGGSSLSEFAMARLAPANRIGTGGEDLLSNNFNWSLPLVGLPGRGLDLGLTLSYNSLVWTRSGNYIDFDVDAGSIAPGFRLGFPVIEGPYQNSQANANFYLLVTPSGGRVELRQISNSIYYEAADSSHLQLTDKISIDGTLLLRPTDGSQMRFNVVGGGWRCTRITDRNGNYLSAVYKPWGEIETVTDTLGRVLTFNYDGNDNLQSITQAWGS